MLAEWYPKIDTCANVHGIKAVRRVSFCDQCLLQSIQKEEKSWKSTRSKSMASNDIRDQVCDTSRVVSPDSAPSADDQPQQQQEQRSVFTPDIPEEVFASADDINISFDSDGEVIVDEEELNSGKDEVDFGSLGLSKEAQELLLEYRANSKGKIIAFELEEASKLLRFNEPIVCPFHLKVEPKNVFPDLVSEDILYICYISGKHHFLYPFSFDF